MEVKKITEGMTAPQVAQVIDDNFKAQNKILEDDIKKQNNAIGVSEYQAFSEAESVAVGAVRLYNGVLYECIETTTGAFDASKWKKSSFKAETEKKLSELGSEINTKAKIKAGKNLLNPITCIKDTFINASNGSTGEMSGGYASDYIEVNGQDLCLNNSNEKGSIVGWAAYDKDKVFTHSGSPRTIYKYQDGDVYVRFSLSTLDGTQVEVGTASTEYEPFNPIAGWGITQLELSKLGKDEFQNTVNGCKTIPNTALQLIDILGNLTPFLITLQEGKYINAINTDGTLSYLDNATFTTFLLPVDGKSIYLFDSARFYVLMKDLDHALNDASLGIYGKSIDSTGANYIALSINTEEYPLESYKIGIGRLVEKTEYRIPNFSLDDKSVKIEKLSFTNACKNKFNIDDKDCRLGEYLANNTSVILDAYNVTGYINVKPNTIYQCSYNGDSVYGEYLARFICQYDDKKEYIEGADLQPSTSTDQFTTGANTHYVRISVNAKYWEKYQVEEGVSPTAWEKYKLVIDEDALPTIQPNMEKTFERLHGSADLTNGQTLTLPQNFVRKNIAFSVKIHRDSSTGLDVLMGLGYNAYVGGWLELTDTKLKVHNYIQSDVVAAEYDHNLTLGSDIVALFDGEIENATIKIISNGQIFSQEINRENYFGGAGFVKNIGTTIHAEMSVMPKDINQKIWLYGDSYLGYLSEDRWLTYMLEWGFTSWMSDSRPGGNSAEGAVSLTNDLKIGKPKYILLLNGMNDGGDADVNTPSTIWMSNMEKVALLAKDVELILATIPSVPTINHEAKNAWVRNSGYRYIDFANAVGADANGTWKSGMLHGDGVHPTILGAKALASQVLVDFPEIMVNFPLK